MTDIIQSEYTTSAASKISKWWKKLSGIKSLVGIKAHLNAHLTHDELQELSNNCCSISKMCIGDGAGLTGGVLIDMLITRYFKEKLPEYKEYHHGEGDMKILDTPLSQKKINGKSTIALDWSKNENSVIRERFSDPIMIINLKSSQWWKNKPIKISSSIKTTYNDVIPAGIYLIDKSFCKYYVNLKKNNKTNTLIDAQYLYIMLKRSMMLDLYIGLPVPNKDVKFNILNAFLE
jgi:hypothetical protein